MHDKNGNPLASGDQVTLVGTFEPSGDASSEYCNGQVNIPQMPGTSMTVCCTVNAKHCEKVFDISGDPIADDKLLRKKLDEALQLLRRTEHTGTPEHAPRRSRERSLAVTKIQEAIMWLGMDLKAINEANPGAAENPYPHSYDPKSPIIDKTADGLKL